MPFPLLTVAGRLEDSKRSLLTHLRMCAGLYFARETAKRDFLKITEVEFLTSVFVCVRYFPSLAYYA